MSLKAGRVGVNPADVDPIDGHINPESVDSYTKVQADAKFETQEAAAALQPKTLAVPIKYLNGSVIGTFNTVQDAFSGSYGEDGAMTNEDLTKLLTEHDSVCTSLIGTSVYNSLVKIGQLVQLDLRMSGVTAEAFNDVLAVIPVGYRPKQTTRVTIYNKTDGTMHTGIAGTEGNLTAEANISNKELCWHVMWFTA